MSEDRGKKHPNPQQTIREIRNGSIRYPTTGTVLSGSGIVAALEQESVLDFGARSGWRWIGRSRSCRWRRGWPSGELTTVSRHGTTTLFAALASPAGSDREVQQASSRHGVPCLLQGVRGGGARRAARASGEAPMARLRLRRRASRTTMRVGKVAISQHWPGS